MTTARRLVSGFTVVLGGLLVGLTATRALAAEPTTAAEAQAAAQESRAQADHFRSLGGSGYKTGLVQRAEADAARFDALAARLAAPPAAAPVTSPEAARYTALAAQFRAMGGAGYKSGLVGWAEAQARKYEAAPAPAAAAAEEAVACLPTKPVVMLACNL